MRFSTIILTTFLAALSVNAQNATAAATSVVVSGTAPLTPAQSSEATCLEACAKDDNTCRSSCISIADQTNGIELCITSCPKGNGTAIDNANYQSCVESCISTAAVTVAPTPTAATATGSAAATATGTSPGSGATATGGSTGSGASSTATGSAATTSKSSAAEAVHIGTSLLGAVGLFAAIFAL